MDDDGSIAPVTTTTVITIFMFDGIEKRHEFLYDDHEVFADDDDFRASATV